MIEEVSKFIHEKRLSGMIDFLLKKYEEYDPEVIGVIKSEIENAMTVKIGAMLRAVFSSNMMEWMSAIHVSSPKEA